MSPSSTLVEPIAAPASAATTAPTTVPTPDRPAAQQAAAPAPDHKLGTAAAKDGSPGRTPAQEAAALKKKERHKAKLRERKLAEAVTRASAQGEAQKAMTTATAAAAKTRAEGEDVPVPKPLLPFPIHVKLPMPAGMRPGSDKPASTPSDPSAVRISAVDPARPSEKTATPELSENATPKRSVEQELTLAKSDGIRPGPGQPTEAEKELKAEQRRRERQQKQKEKNQRRKERLAAAAVAAAAEEAGAGAEAKAKAASGEGAVCNAAPVQGQQTASTSSSSPSSSAAAHEHQADTQSAAPSITLLEPSTFLFAASAPPSSSADMADLYNEAGSRAVSTKSKKTHGEELTMRVSLKPLPGLAKLPPGGQQRRKYRQEMGVVEVQLKRKSHTPAETAVVSEEANREQKDAISVKLPQLPTSKKTEAQPERPEVRSSTVANLASPPLSRQHSHSVSRSNANSPHPFMHHHPHHHKAASVSSTCPSTHVPTPPASVSSLSLAHASRPVVVSDEAEHDAAAAASPRDRLFSLTRSVLDDPAIVASHRTKAPPSMRAIPSHAGGGVSQQEQSRKEQIRSEILSGSSSSRRSSPVPGMNGLSLLAGVPASGSGHISGQQAGSSSAVDLSTLPLSYQMPAPFPVAGDAPQQVSGFPGQYPSEEPDAAYQTFVMGQDGNAYVYVQDPAGSSTAYDPQLHYPHAAPSDFAAYQYGQQQQHSASVEAPRPNKFASLPTTIRPYDSPPVSPHQPSHQVHTHRFSAGYPLHFAHAQAQAAGAAYTYARSAASSSSSLHLGPATAAAAAPALTPISSGGVTYFMPAYAPQHAFASALSVPVRVFSDAHGQEVYAGGAEADEYAQGEAGEADVAAPDWNGGMFGQHPHPSQYIQPQYAYMLPHHHPHPPQQSHYPYPTFYYHSQHEQAHGPVQY